MATIIPASALGDCKLVGYRFCTSDVARSMLETGSVKVAAAAEFWAWDGTLGGRGDPLEARRFWKPPEGPLSYKDTVALNRIGSPAWKAGDPLAKFRIAEGARFGLRSSAYLFCYSYLLGGSLVRRMARMFGYDACVRITDVVRFANEVSLALPELTAFSAPDWNAGRYLLGGVHYADVPPETPHYRDVDLFEKNIEYRWQREGRIVWRGKGVVKGAMGLVPSVRCLLEPADLSRFS